MPWQCIGKSGQGLNAIIIYLLDDALAGRWGCGRMKITYLEEIVGDEELFCYLVQSETCFI
eukprot:scaffold77555_cov54-Cyclotella_meneghiniana.AAC.3